MTDSNIIWNHLNRHYDNSHPFIYQNCVNKKLIGSNDISYKIFSALKDIFCPPIDENYVKNIIKQYLENKKHLYKNGKLSIKSIY